MLFAFDFGDWKFLAAVIGLAILLAFAFVFRDYESGHAAGERFRKKHPILARVVGVVVVLAFICVVIFVRSR